MASALMMFGVILLIGALFAYTYYETYTFPLFGTIIKYPYREYAFPLAIIGAAFLLAGLAYYMVQTEPKQS